MVISTCKASHAIDSESLNDSAKIHFDAEIDTQYIEQFRYMPELNKDVILFNWVPIDYKTSIKELSSRSSYDDSDFKIGNYSYRISTNCPERGIALFDAIGGWNYGGAVI
ncbi:hypothetical protein [Ketobacter alkanivorans]|uniref:Uncharacterized protein n=1 Tax=Ketobacter alkanivorans TaxID=1917421 RepID=A0A2K9LKV5_9GAMM|nr:hypothetical protein [Ketobacter alkanivorans]AUM12811.1 hypothetical protein Kalk_10445 [Ketobacter alkanivorans]